MFDSWKTNPSSLTSNLEKNAELKGLLLEETPWVLQAQNESERKKRVALMFDINRMENERNDALKKLEQMQLDNGGWPWFKGSHDDRYITQYLVTGFAHLKQLNAIDEKEADRVQKMLDQAIPYCSARAEEAYTRMKRDTSMDKATYVPDNLILQYVYAMSYYPQFREQLSPTQKEAFDYYLKQIENNWTKYDLYQKGLIALILHRDNKTKTTEKIIKSLTENSMRSEEMGMYWKTKAKHTK